MKISDLLVPEEAYIIIKNEYNKTKFWCEDSWGYTYDILDAGVFTKDYINKFNIKICSDKETVSGLFKKYTHVAVNIRMVLSSLTKIL